jgi:putative glutamine amidotransferase
VAALPRVAVARWEHVPGERLESYWRSLREAGLEPLDHCKPRQSLGACAGLLLTGGIDVDPALYGETPWPEVPNTNRDRDEFELALLREALDRDLPVLAVCRGHQLLNVALGGRLLQHIAGDAHEVLDDDVTSMQHSLRLASDSKLRAIYGAELIVVNSRHHQAVTLDRLAPGLRATGTTDDGLIEAVESDSHSWVVGVQWHPEREDQYIEGFAEASRRLWSAFAEQIRRGLNAVE